jgi:hypothetical protein
MANIGLGQVQRGGEAELPLITSGDDVAGVARFLRPEYRSYTAGDVIDFLLADVRTSVPAGETPRGGTEGDRRATAPCVA